MSTRHQHGHPYSFDAPVGCLTSLQYHVMGGSQCGYCGRPAEVVRVVRMNAEGTARCGTPTLAGLLCFPCAHGEQNKLKTINGFTVDQDTCTFTPGTRAKVLRLVDTSARERVPDAGVELAPHAAEPPTSAPARPLTAHEARLLHRLRTGPARGIAQGAWRKTALQLRDRGLVVIVERVVVERKRRRRTRIIKLTPFGQQLASFLPAHGRIPCPR